ncbi:hypothetical protein FACS1894159_04850 [Bacteroidia bacterium]|nr:hypothetical protein FACS1894159_04850 [Bacteroidia bacterium]
MRTGNAIKKLFVGLAAALAFILWVEAGAVVAGQVYSGAQRQQNQCSESVLLDHIPCEAALFEIVAGSSTGSCPVRVIERNAPGGASTLAFCRAAAIGTPPRIFAGPQKYQPFPLSVPGRSADYYVLTLRRLII